jgi:hypothetical protein
MMRSPVGGTHARMARPFAPTIPIRLDHQARDQQREHCRKQGRGAAVIDRLVPDLPWREQ